MAGRPRADADGAPARERIRDAFWGILAQGAYADVTIKRIASDAGVNHKTIYYHYPNVDALARECFLENIADVKAGEDPLTLIAIGSPAYRGLVRDGAFMEKVSRMLLFARSDSAYLNSIFREHVRATWLEVLGVDEDDLSKNDEVDIDFMLGGLISLVGRNATPEAFQRIPRIFERELGQAMLETMERLRSKAGGTAGGR